MRKSSAIRDVAASCSVALALGVLFGIYLFTRQGYFMLERVMADTSMMLLAFTFLIGPLARYFDRFDGWMRYRKDIGIVAGAMAILHGYLVFGIVSGVAGLAGLAGLVSIVLVYSSSILKAFGQLESVRWWFFQRFGLRVIILFSLIHVFVLRWDEWRVWFVRGGGLSELEVAHPLLPSLDLLVMLFTLWVVCIRIYESIFLFKSVGWKARDIGTDPVVHARGRMFFLWSFGTLLAAYVLIFVRSMMFL